MKTFCWMILEVSRSLIRYCFVLFLFLGLHACSDNEQQSKQDRKQYHIHGPTMGTQFSIKMIGVADNHWDTRWLETEVKTLLTRINRTMSTYIDDSELSLLNQKAENEYHTVSDALYFVLKESIFISSITRGTFDITVGPLVNLWGFGTNKEKQSRPSQHDIYLAQYSIGTYRLKLHDDKTLRKNRPGMYIDLSAIAKGYAVDQIAEWLETQRIKDYMVEIGGEIKVKGKNKNNQYWQIGIEQPRLDGRAVQKIMPLRDSAMATSGDYRNYFEEEGIRYSHIIDPVSGKPVQHALASVSVIHSSAARADALATAMLVMGPDKAMEFAKNNNLAVLMLIKNQDSEGFHEKMSPVLERIKLY